MVEPPPIRLQGDVSEVPTLGHLSVIETEPKATTTAIYAQRAKEIESKAGGAATCTQVNAAMHDTSPHDTLA